MEEQRERDGCRSRNGKNRKNGKNENKRREWNETGLDIAAAVGEVMSND